MAGRGLSVDHTTVWRWTQRYAPELECPLRGQVKPKGSTWHIDETFVRISGRWMYLFRAVDNRGQTVDFYLSETRDREAAKCFLKRALANPDNRLPHVFARDRLRSYPAAIRELQQEGQLPSAVDIEPNATRIIASNPTTVILNDACARCRVHERRRPRVRLLRESKQYR